MILSIMFDRLAGGEHDNPFMTSLLDAWKTKDLEGEARKEQDLHLLAK